MTFTTGSDVGDREIAAQLRERKVYVGRRNLGIRVACHFWNTNEDADRLLADLESIVA